MRKEQASLETKQNEMRHKVNTWRWKKHLSEIGKDCNKTKIAEVWVKCTQDLLEKVTDLKKMELGDKKPAEFFPEWRGGNKRRNDNVVNLTRTFWNIWPMPRSSYDSSDSHPTSTLPMMSELSLLQRKREPQTLHGGVGISIVKL